MNYDEACEMLFSLLSVSAQSKGWSVDRVDWEYPERRGIMVIDYKRFITQRFAGSFQVNDVVTAEQCADFTACIHNRLD
jgi:hypothetical protein